MNIRPPQGYRLLEAGEYVRRGDLFLLGNVAWEPIKNGRGPYSPDKHWPISRPIEPE